jgi:hypothetical protein
MALQSRPYSQTFFARGQGGLLIMENPQESFANTQSESHPLECEEQLPEDWRLARTARVNLLLIHRTRPIENLLGLIAQDLPKPIATWRPGERLTLPALGHMGTVILHDVGALAKDDQARLLEWLERVSGRVQVVSTTQTPLLPRVQAGKFDDTLYYRLNTVCVDCDRVELES